MSKESALKEILSKKLLKSLLMSEAKEMDICSLLRVDSVRLSLYTSQLLLSLRKKIQKIITSGKLLQKRQILKTPSILHLDNLEL